MKNRSHKTKIIAYKKYLLFMTIFFISLSIAIPSILPQENTYNVNVNIIENHAPYLDKLIFPLHGQVDVVLNPALTVRVIDPNNDTIDIYFYNAFNDELIGYNINVPSGDESSVIWSNLTYDTFYEWYVIVNDSLLSNTSEIWSFTSLNKPSSPSTHRPVINNPPVADASNSQLIGVVDEEVRFDATKSFDSDGVIVNYSWDFDDRSFGYGSQIKHSYHEEGNYHVSLQVRDDFGSTNKDIIQIVIVKQNLPPSKPSFDGITMGHQNISYSFEIKSTDPDNDMLQYVINWGDETNQETSFHLSGESINQSHQWKNYGEYTIIAYATDNETQSEPIEKTIYIDVLPIDEEEVKGYLIDENSDEIYNLYDNSDTGIKTITKLDNSTYLIDINNDNKWDYTYSLDSGLSIYYLYLYNKYYNIYLETPGFDIISLMAIFSIILVFYYKKRR